MIRYALIGLAFLSLFVFPWPLTVALTFVASLYIPPLALLMGALAEILYGTGGMPYALIVGVVGSVVAYFVRRLIKTRIMDV